MKRNFSIYQKIQNPASLALFENGIVRSQRYLLHLQAKFTQSRLLEMACKDFTGCENWPICVYRDFFSQWRTQICEYFGVSHAILIIAILEIIQVTSDSVFKLAWEAMLLHIEISRLQYFPKEILLGIPFLD